ncbi:acyl-CoA dehydrogenase family protein [Henriciella litoralis]|uniref:acyl-CoA dehydrogenase family protein n=1 Tax=Henriciella litoralis TaxID=568102 RepID=UPI0009FDF924|nr:acyl-CoA dehydrogenase family protein [Henriciella litoralis]
MNLDFTPEDEAFRAEVAGWLAANLVGEFEQLKFRGGPGDEDAFPEERKAWERRLGEAGWIGLGWPEAHGGRNLPLVRQMIFNEEYARAGGPGRAGHIGETLVAPTLIALGTDAQKTRFLPDIRSGTEYWCQGYSEPNAGSDLANVATKARLEGGKWVLNGQKVWTSLAHEADWAFVIARSEPGSVGREGLVYLLVPMDQPGVTVRPIVQMTGSSEFNEVYFDEAVTDAENIVGAPGDGWKVAMATLSFERGASTLGQQMQFRNELAMIIDVANRNGAGRNPAIRQRIAKAWAQLAIMRMNALRTLGDSTATTLGREGYISKIYWATWHRNLGELAMDVLGEDAERWEADPVTSRLQKLFLFSRADTIYAGTNQIQRNIIAERALGMPREAREKTSG